MRNLDSITFDATNFIFHGDEDGVRIWHNAAGDGIGLYYFPIPPDIPADLDSLEDVRSAYRKLAATSFNLEDFRAGRHIVRDKRGWRVRDIQVESMWLARIEPSFHQLSYLMVVHADKQPQATFCFGGTDSLPKVTGEPIDCPALDDRIVASLKDIDLLSSDDELSLDGIAYSLHVCTSSLSAGLMFANPKTKSLRSVERALFEVAENIARVMESSELIDYLKTWRRYLN